MLAEDTIAAIATPIGEGGIGIIRISGSEALIIAEKIFKPKNGKKITQATGYQIFYGHLIDPDAAAEDSGTVIDEVLLSVFKAPYSFTTEDTVEINCHSGLVVLQKILRLVLRVGARLAEPGEFSKRAFLNGRLDLVQAEAIIDIIRSRSERGLQIAVKQLSGDLSEQVQYCRQQLLDIIAHIEALIDFPEDDIADLPLADIINLTDTIISRLQQLLEQASIGRIYREGLNVSIIGRPNVGKSSLLNMLLQEDRAIVSAIPGTTRDVIEEQIRIKGIPFKICDTAGIRETQDEIEKIGVERSLQSMQQADLILYLLTAEKEMSAEEQQILSELMQQKDKKIIIIINKIDLQQPEEAIKKQLMLTGLPVVEIAALTGLGIDKLIAVIVDLVLTGAVKSSAEPLVSNIRQQHCLEESKEFLDSAQVNIQKGMPLDLISIDFRAAWDKLGEITGETVSDEIVEQIFSRFCVGK